jgi:hypothetical protein
MKWSIGEKESKECNKSVTLLKFQRINILDDAVPAEDGLKFKICRCLSSLKEALSLCHVSVDLPF